MDKNSKRHLKEHIIDIKDGLPKKQRELCDFILKHFSGLGLATIKELSDQAGVGISTVMRTIKALGYDNYNDFRKDIYEGALPDESKWTLKNSIGTLSDNQNSVVKVWEESVKLLESSLDETFIQAFDAAISRIIAAGNISIIGSRPYKSAATYMGQVMGEFQSNVRTLDNDAETLFDKILHMEKGELMIVFSFEPYTSLVVNAVNEARGRGVEIILITDYDSNPLIREADVVIKLSINQSHFTILPIIALIDAIVLEAGKHSTSETVEKLKLLEETLLKNNILYDR
ncbi:MurR/RpiR family transcriptional regulator [Lacicoccus qingdaonensis]|uniref:Transcriptional regulator, RpiR family n=1 Tax=Lacicoccus qingdaonensis TaxID=576118 RepID=A0A1G9B0C4_9BACL|nr:MurR/RpiR family transcriptional regulator [Salinicoccus qingdaonensis]SDK32898.1 transcriptional regulator, RpiR family [Salinicoccus qingdaonensis]